MIVMQWFRTPRGVAIWPTLLFLLLAPGCSRPAEPKTDDTAQAGQRRVPFQDGESAKGNPSLSAPPAQGNSLKPESSLPFRDFQGLPAGTLLTVRLKNPIFADGRGASEAFDAIVDEPVLVEGNTLLPRGASVAGRVEAAHASRLKRNRGYVRLKLDSLAFAGQELPIQTSSLFVNGNADESEAEGSEGSPGIIRLESGRRLTFRLTEPVLLTSRTATPGR
jgi:hypothetical protein